MKNILCLFLALILSLTFVSCSKKDAENNTLNSKAANQSSQNTSDNSAEIDLTAMSATMVYTELYNMVAKPDAFVGKTVKMRGKYSVYKGDGRKYYVCEVTDSTACCSQGLEFILKDGEEYPEYDSKVPCEIEISGKFNTYLEDNQQYVQLEEASLRVLE